MQVLVRRIIVFCLLGYQMIGCFLVEASGALVFSIVWIPGLGGLPGTLFADSFMGSTHLVSGTVVFLPNCRKIEPQVGSTTFELWLLRLETRNPKP